ncbi:glycogen synthase kinase 3 [Plasmodium gonderi]|uniref:Glycogen synthase kinase 3 n=1 Tax=Plasmodium gonderi TaxID=77519 RepID=A0A1Y1JHJ8_PLAGO|nr:glycogen synthase kinase 3 [Plasmodium gonderi]GAW80697.1 glycogen synthase kinase 3 [Plasmodium gonderi]
MKDWHTDDQKSAHLENEKNCSESVVRNEPMHRVEPLKDNNHVTNRKSENEINRNEGIDNMDNDEKVIIIENEINRSSNKSYKLGNMIGNGSFGVVYEAMCLDTSEKVAIKKVLQDPQYKNRELIIMKNLSHVNIIYLKDYYYTECVKKNEKNVFLNVVMEYIPQTVHKYMKYYARNNHSLPLLLVKLYAYQLCRALGYLHSKLICHRDLKPQNLLVEPKTHTLKLCDFGSAKNLLAGQRSVSYICSRFYRAPELMLGSTSYTTHIDLWSLGCIISEMILGYPLFSGQSSVDQLVRIIQVLGTPTEEQMKVMNPNYADIKFPDVKAKDLRKIFPKGTSEDAINFVSHFLKYEPLKRLNAIEALADPFFDELRDPCIKLPKFLEKLPELFNFSDEEIKEMSDSCKRKLLPKDTYEKYKDYILNNPCDNENIADNILNECNETNLDNNVSRAVNLA